MKRSMMALCVCTLLTLFPAHEGFAFLDGLLSRSSQNKNSGDGLLNALGGSLGLQNKEMSLIKQGIKTVKALQPLSQKAEVALGQTISVEVFRRFGGEYQNKALLRYINLVGQTLSEVSDRPELDFHFAVLNTPDQNAFAAPGGYVFVTLGLIQTLKNEAELAAILAHEIAHITQRHMLSTMKRSALLSNLSELSLTAMDQDPKLMSNLVGELSELLFTKGLDQSLEYEADVLALSYTYQAGYSPKGLKNHLKILSRQQGHVKSVFFSTHPSVKNRIKRIDQALKKYSDTTHLSFLSKRFDTQIKKAGLKKN